MKQLSEHDAKRLADAWVEQQGGSLLTEAEAMRLQGVDYQTPRSDETVRALVSGRSKQTRRRRTPLPAILATAACLIFAALFVGIPALTNSPLAESPSPISPNGSVDSASSAPQLVVQMLPLTFSLPADFRKTGEDYDNGTTLYTLESPSFGRVVLAMRSTGDDELIDSHQVANGTTVPMREVVIDGTVVSARIDSAYMLLAFSHGSIDYTLTSQDNLGALAAFYRSIVGAP
ncbi:MAG: hypothetical protein FWD27_05710 [Coriobacteriia bacterium]|nr:hypothetical protein [Coriobacteriia bacterium]